MKLALKITNFQRKYAQPWKSCLPFVDNARAMLIHRPRSVAKFTNLKLPHLAVHTWCGSGFTGSDKFTFLDTLDGTKLLCSRCEANAVGAGLPSTDEIVGKHIHKGKIVPVQTCCEIKD